MSPSAPSPPPVRQRRLGYVLAVIVILIVAFSYYRFVKRKTEYLASRNLRVLATISAEIESSIEAQRGFLRNFAKAVGEKQLVRGERAALNDDDRQRFDLFYPHFESLKHLDSRAAETWSEELIPVRGGLSLRMKYESFLGSAEGEVPLARLLEPTVRAGMADVFDTVLLADAQGKILFRAAAEKHDPAVALSTRDAQATHIDGGVRITELGVLRTKKGWRELEAISLGSVLGTTRQISVDAGGKSYQLFAQPAELLSPKEEKAAPAWTVCGMVSSSRFTQDALAISVTVLAIAVALLLVAVAAWPFLRLALMRESRPVTIADAIMLLVGTVLGGAVLTMAIADAVVYRRLEAVGDVQLRQWGQQLVGRFQEDIDGALSVTDKLREGWRPDVSNPFAVNEGFFEQQWTEPGLMFYSFSWIDEKANQIYKRSVGPRVPAVNVRERDYFRRARSGDLWRTEWNREQPREFALESIRSMTTGRSEVVVSVPTKRNDVPVFALTLAVSPVIDPVEPVAFDFAVIDAAGRVIFHSNAKRNGVQNFFDETERNRQLRAAVFARHEDMVSIRYGGEDYRAYVRPMEGVPWTMIAMRHKRLLRTVNVEAIVMTLMCLAIYSAVCIAIVGAICIVNPRYRAPWAWPDPKRRALYRRLSLALACLGAAAMLTILLYDATPLLTLSVLMPLHAMVTAYLMLHDVPYRRPFLIVGAVWIALTLIWLTLIGRAESSTAMVFSGGPLEFVIALLILAPAALAVRRPKPSVDDGGGRAYTLAVALVILLTSVLPTIGFFKAAYLLELRSYLKYGQLVLADAVERRLERLSEWSFGDHLRVERGFRFPSFYNTNIWLEREGSAIAPAAVRNRAGQALAMERMGVPEFLEDVLPQYSDESIPMRELHHEHASDDAWEWWITDQNLLVLERRMRLAPTAAKIWSPAERAAAKQQVMVMATRLPTTLPSWLMRKPKLGDELAAGGSLPALSATHADSELHRLVRRSMYGIAVVLMVALLWFAAQFITRKLFLFDIQEPLWLSRTIGPRPGDHIFLVRQERRTRRLVARGYLRIRLNRLGRPDDWPQVIGRIDAQPAGQNVLIEDFEIEPHDAAWREAKLSILEHVLRLHDRSAVITSTIRPMAFLSAAKTAEERARWEQALSVFVWLSEAQLELHEPLRALPPGPTAHPAPVLAPRERAVQVIKTAGQTLRDVWGRSAVRDDLAAEAAGDRILMQIVNDLHGRSFADKAQFIDEMRERAETYYAGLWTACSPDEKRLLYQLGQEGLLNGRNRRMVRRLLARGLVRRMPHLTLLNESFRQYVCAAGVREGLAKPPAEVEDNAYEMFSKPVAIVLVAVAVMFFTTQKDLLNTTSAVITALAGGVPAVIKLIHILTARRDPTAP